MLLLKKHLVLLVRQGKKRQTIRLWSRPLLRPGQISYTPGLGKMKITAIDLLPTLADLTHEDALLDGFDSLPALLNEIKQIYGPTPKNKAIYRIQFDWPIDSAGQSLVLAPPEIPAPKPHSQPPAPTPQKSTAQLAARQTTMSFRQRQTLRDHILKKSPSPQ